MSPSFLFANFVAVIVFFCGIVLWSDERTLTSAIICFVLSVIILTAAIIDQTRDD